MMFAAAVKLSPKFRLPEIFTPPQTSVEEQFSSPFTENDTSPPKPSVRLTVPRNGIPNKGWSNWQWPRSPEKLPLKRYRVLGVPSQHFSNLVTETIALRS